MKVSWASIPALLSTRKISWCRSSFSTTTRKGATPDAITEEAITAHLDTAGQPDPDLLIRTGGEHRISNFLVWQAAYCEYHFTGTAWPDFGPAEVDAALIEFSNRRRRFGLVPEDSDASR